MPCGLYRPTLASRDDTEEVAHLDGVVAGLVPAMPQLRTEILEAADIHRPSGFRSAQPGL
jgi:hypothetical protein